ncbi:MAG: hypothetical protein JWO32_532 [Bacteroidetes bacterium]|nr:hypothetical protein [Bacteroidota bacterium]
MKTTIILTAGVIGLYQVAKHYNINSLESLKKVVMPLINEFIPQLKRITSR